MHAENKKTDRKLLRNVMAYLGRFPRWPKPGVLLRDSRSVKKRSKIFPIQLGICGRFCSKNWLREMRTHSFSVSAHKYAVYMLKNDQQINYFSYQDTNTKRHFKKRKCQKKSAQKTTGGYYKSK